MTTEILSKKKMYVGPIFDLSHYEVVLPNGKTGQRDVIEHNGACVMIPVAEDGRLVMVRQHRAGANAMLLEFPAGKLDNGEDPEKCALRELSEETGYVASKVRLLTRVHPVAAWCTEIVNVFLMEDLILGEASPDRDENGEIIEFVEVELHSLPDLLAMIDKGELMDMKTVMGVLMYARIRNI